MTEERTVSDVEAQTILFTYHMYPFAQPNTVQKVDSDHWIAIFEKPSETPPPEIVIEKIRENEFRVVFKPQ